MIRNGPQAPPRLVLFGASNMIGDIFDCASARGLQVAEIVMNQEEVLRERMIVGTPARVIARLKQLEDELGLDGILAELNPGSRIPHAQVMTALRLLCEEVIPAFK